MALPAHADSAELSRLPRASASTCMSLPQGIIVRSAENDLQCQLVSGAGIGVQSLLDAGVISAVDLWGAATVEAEVCFAARGRLLFLDAATSPRQQLPLAYHLRDGHTCGSIQGAGTALLMPAPAAQPVAPAAIPVVPVIPDPLENLVEYEECWVVAQYNLFYREKPAGAILGLVHGGWSLQALARTDNWYMVKHGDKVGWISLHYSWGERECN